jgi:hypothetical protein
VNEVWTVMDRVERRAPWREHDNWRDSAFRDMPGFGPLERAEFFHRQPTTPDGVVRRVASVSHVAVLPAGERADVLTEIEHILATHPDVRGKATIDIPYRVDCLCVERR